MNIDWSSSKNEILINPRFPEEEKHALLKMIEQAPTLQGHIWMATSGTTGQFKMAALSKEALLISARSVNEHLECDRNDIWLNSLPDFHVGGLGVVARSHVAECKMVIYPQMKWDPLVFHRALVENKITLTSMVPTQIYDMIVHRLKAPATLRAVIVGGGKLSENLFFHAKKLGWNVAPSYGLTECCSQVATAPLKNNDMSLKILSHVEVKIDPEGFIEIKSPSLLTRYASIDPKVNGWFKTEDKGEIKDGFLTIRGRTSTFVKIGGESVDLSRLEKILDEIKLANHAKDDIVIIAVPDDRLGHAIHLCAAVDSKEKIQNIIDAFQEKVLPYEKIRNVHLLQHIPRTAIHKLERHKLLEMI